jgi:cytochrome P450 family 6
MFVSAFILIPLVGLLYYYVNESFKFWTKLGFKQLKPKFFFGDIKDLVFQKKCIAQFFEEIYKKTKQEPLTGIYLLHRPALVINDIELAKTILIRDFQYFHDRGALCDEELDPLSINLFLASGERWKSLRQKLTPLFSPTKLKGMFPIIDDCADILEKYIDDNNNEGKHSFDICDLLSRYTLTVISSIAFGVEHDSINEPHNIFSKYTLKLFNPTFVTNLRIYLAFFAPKISKFFGIRFAEKSIFEFFHSLVNQTIEYREKNNITRQDFLQLLIQLKNEGFNNSSTDKLTINEVTANAFLFAIAGYESSSLTMSFCLYELARNEEMMRKIQAEIDTKLNGDFSFEKLNELHFLECCISETLRKYSTVPVVIRVSKIDYTMPGTSLTIPKETPIIIPNFAMQRDPDLIMNPMEFQPERFDSKNYDKEHFIIPFGSGQRYCIGIQCTFLF